VANVARYEQAGLARFEEERVPWERPPAAVSLGIQRGSEETIHVYIADGELKTDHSFYLAGQRFLTLHYAIERLAPPIPT
jgi:hypothetical protein